MSIQEKIKLADEIISKYRKRKSHTLTGNEIKTFINDRLTRSYWRVIEKRDAPFIIK
jgi:hypothetical protein